MKRLPFLITAGLLATATLAVAGGAGSVLIAKSEVLWKEIVLWDVTCPPERHEHCAVDERELAKRLLAFADYCDASAADFDGLIGDDAKTAQAGWKLQARAARFYAERRHDRNEAAAIGLRQNRFESLARFNRANVEIGDFAGFVFALRFQLTGAAFQIPLPYPILRQVVIVKPTNE